MDDGSYRQRLFFPPLRGEIQGLTQVGSRPAVQTTAGFRLNSPPVFAPFPFIPLGPSSQSFFSAGTQSQSPPFRRLMPRPFGPVANLFLPNTIKQPVESRAQLEEYKKYLKETAEEDEKERNLNIVGIDTTSFDKSLEDGSATTSSFVKLHVKGQDYSYST